jgi:hypothetical protein
MANLKVGIGKQHGQRSSLSLVDETSRRSLKHFPAHYVCQSGDSATYLPPPSFVSTFSFISLALNLLISVSICFSIFSRDSLSLASLSLKLLVKLIDPAQHPKLADKAHSLYAEVHEICKPFREWRNRRGAHRDLDTSLNRHADPLPEASRQMIENALQKIDALMNALLGHFDNGKMKFFGGLELLGGGEDLIACLGIAIAHRQEERRKMGF